MEEQVPPEKNETGTAVPGVKVDRCGEWGLQLVSQLSPELVLTSAAWGLSAALVKGTVGKILSRFATLVKLLLGNSRPNAPLTLAAPLTDACLKPAVGSSIHAN